ncbi:MAG TPA: FecR family protein, partial [Chitinophagaceae bacterium]|nr:FecR family protein [Chitinophagaceae bacterium]
MTQEAHIAQLAVKHVTGTLSEPELAELTQWLEASPEHRHLFGAYTHPDFISKEYKNRADRKDRLEARIGNLSSAGLSGYQDSPEQVSDLYPENIPVVHRVHFLKTSWFRYAAAAVLLLGGAAIWREVSRSPRREGGAETTVAKNQDIQPGSNKAILTVGDNKPIDLASDKSGVAIGATTTYIDGSSIEGLAGSHQRTTINTLTTPRGGQYQAVLPDGSKVWLNAESGIRFPSKFTGEERSVEISGEVYIEVKQNARQPFLVHTGKTIIQVLGT